MIQKSDIELDKQMMALLDDHSAAKTNNKINLGIRSIIIVITWIKHEPISSFLSYG